MGNYGKIRENLGGERVVGLLADFEGTDVNAGELGDKAENKNGKD
jgi:hypothetical protein